MPGRRPRKKRKPADQKLDDAVEQTFPASDPAASGHATGTERASRPTDRQAPIITKEDVERASRGQQGGGANASGDGTVRRRAKHQRD